MNISQHHKKEGWFRRVADTSQIREASNADNYYWPETNPSDPMQPLTQTDFLREIEASAHSINDKYQSTRPIQEVREREVKVTNEETGEVEVKTISEWIVTGFDPLETARLGYQKRFAFTKSAHGAGDGFTINNEQTDKSEKAHQRFDTLNSWKDIAGLDQALMEVHLSCNQTCDVGVYQYVTASGDIEYKTYSFLDGYEICPDIDENGNPIYYIYYSLKGQPACDIHSTEFFETWVQADVTTSDDGGIINLWWDKVKGLFKSHPKDMQVSEDGWRCVKHKETQIAKGIGQFTYFRTRDIPSGASQLDIEATERTASFVLEGVKSATFDTLFVKAPDIENLPPIGGHGNVLGVHGNVDELNASDAKRLAPADISNVATVALKELKDSILHSTMSVILDPDILRSGADSSSAMKLCFNDEVKYAMAMQPMFFKPLKHLVTVFKYLVAKVEGDPEYASLRTSITQNIWVPQNFSENVENTCKLVYADVLSRENARHEIDTNYPDDMAMVMQEKEDKIYLETFAKLKAEAEARKQFGLEDTANDVIVDNTQSKSGTDDNPYNKIDNQAKS